MANVLITHSYHLPYDAKQQRKMQPYMPLATLYAATALIQSGLSVVTFDPMFEEPSFSIPKLLQAEQPKVVVVYEDDFNFLSKMCLTRMREIAWEIARMARASGAATIVHGSDSTDSPQLFLENGFDYVLCGEAEATLVGLCQCILRGSPVGEIDGIHGLVRLDDRRQLVRSAPALAKNPAWAELPPPARELIDMEPYRRAWITAHGYFSANMVSSRGCPYRCNWCAKPISANKFQLRAPAAVAEEMRLLKQRYGVEHIWFGDDIFALDHDWVRQFAEEVTKRNAAIAFKVQSRANLMTVETVEHLRTAGCVEVWMGVESGSQAVLDAMDKGLSLHSVRAARRRLQDAGIRACYFLQFGYPGEGGAELQQTIAFVRETRPDEIGVSFSYPLPGTVFYERVRQQLGAKRNWADSDDLCIMFRAAYKTEFYRAVRDALHAEVDSWTRSAESAAEKQALAALWAKVDELEPICRNAEATILQSGPAALVQPTFASAEELTAGVA